MRYQLMLEKHVEGTHRAEILWVVARVDALRHVEINEETDNVPIGCNNKPEIIVTEVSVKKAFAIQYLQGCTECETQIGLSHCCDCTYL